MNKAGREANGSLWDIFGCHNLGLNSGDATATQRMEARDAVYIAWGVHILKQFAAV